MVRRNQGLGVGRLVFDLLNDAIKPRLNLSQGHKIVGLVDAERDIAPHGEMQDRIETDENTLPVR